MSSVPPFFAAFDRLHREMRLLLHDSGATFDEAVTSLARRRLLRGDEEAFLDMCRSLRNFLAHSHDAVAMRLLRIEVDAGAPERLNAIADRVARRVPAGRFSVPWPRVRCGRPDEPLEPLMAEMIARDFSHVPILSAAGLMTALFDERVLFRALASDRLDEVTPRTRLGDVVDADHFVRCPPQEAGVLFVPRRASLADLRLLLAETRSGRIGLLVVTEQGDRFERPIGLMTIWDLPGD